MLGDNELDERGSAGAPPARPVAASTGGALAPMGRYPYQTWQEEPQDGEGIDVQKYLRIVMRHWLVIAAAAVVALVIGILITLLTTPLYTASGTLQIDRAAAQLTGVQTFEVKEGAANSADEFFQTQYALLKSRSLAEATARDPELDLVHDTELLTGLGLIKKGQPAPTTAQAQAMLTGFIFSHLEVAPYQRSRIFTLSITSPSASGSARIVNAVASNFIHQTLERRLKASSDGVVFLQDQLRTEKAKLEESERKLADYATKQQLVNIAPSAGGGAAAAGQMGGAPATRTGSSAANQTLAASSLSAMVDALNQARTARIAAQQKWQIGQQAAGPNSTEVLTSGVIQALKQERARLQGQYDSDLNTYRPNMPSMVTQAARIKELDLRVEAETRAIQNSLTTNLESQYRIAAAQESKLQAEVSRLTGSVLDTRSRSIQYDILQREVDTSHQLYDSLLQKYKEIGVSANLETNNISIVDTAVPPGGPSEPNVLRNITTALTLGLMVGLILAFLLEMLDESIRAPEDVERKLNLPLLGSTPKLEKGASPDEALNDPRSAFSEAYYSVRTALQFSTNEGAPASLVVTSARPAEGKSTSARAIARNFARVGSRVLLIDADLRNPSLHRAMRSDNAEGLSNYLTGAKSLRQLAKATDTENLFFIPCGPLPPNPAELLAGNKVEAMLAEAREMFDVVIIDAPPVMGLADAPMLASVAAGTILIVEAGGTGRRLAKTSLRRLMVGNTRLLGVVLTKFDARKGSYGYGYGYGYAYDYSYGPTRAIKKQ